MKKILIAIMILAFAGSVNAQNGRKDKDHRKDQLHRKENARQKMMNRGHLRENLNLTTEQSTRIKAINETFRKDMQQLRDEKLTVKERNDKKHELQQKHVQDIQAVLTAEQKEQLAKNKKDQKEKIVDERKERAKNASRDLNLSEDQRQKLAVLRESYKVKAETLRNDNTLTKEQKRERLQQLMVQQREEMKTILTAEQINQLQDRRIKGKKVK
jgi:Spy/CpxP family protein refolding chaperone